MRDLGSALVSDNKLDEARKHYGESFDDVAKPAYKEIMESGIDMPVLAVLGSSEYLPHLMYTLGPETADFIALAKANPIAAIRKAVLMEGLIAAELKKTAEPKEAKPEVKAESKPEPSPEPKPRAPKPPTEVGGRGAPAERADLAAARAGNFRDFDAEMKRKYGAGLR